MHEYVSPCSFLYEWQEKYSEVLCSCWLYCDTMKYGQSQTTGFDQITEYTGIHIVYVFFFLFSFYVHIKLALFQFAPDWILIWFKFISVGFPAQILWINKYVTLLLVLLYHYMVYQLCIDKNMYVNTTRSMNMCVMIWTCDELNSVVTWILPIAKVQRLTIHFVLWERNINVMLITEVIYFP